MADYVIVKKEPHALKQWPKHLTKIRLWSWISKRGAIRIIMFNGIMNAIKFDKIIEFGLVLFVKSFFLNGHRLQQDNDSKHSGKYVKFLFKLHGIYLWKPHRSH